jgi:hypothetical protein
MAVPVLTYESEIWTTIEKEREPKLENAEMKFLRSVARYTKKDGIENIKTRKELDFKGF